MVVNAVVVLTAGNSVGQDVEAKFRQEAARCEASVNDDAGGHVEDVHIFFQATPELFALLPQLPKLKLVAITGVSPDTASFACLARCPRLEKKCH